MCETRVFLGEGDDERQIMDDVVLVEPDNDTCLLVSLLGEQRLVRGRIRKIDFLKHTLHLSPMPDSA